MKSVGSDGKEGQMSPHRLLASTIGDELQISNDFRSKVIGVALKDRASTFRLVMQLMPLLVGHFCRAFRYLYVLYRPSSTVGYRL